MAPRDERPPSFMYLLQFCNPISPLPTICFSLGSIAISRYWGIPLYRIGGYYTAGIGLITALYTVSSYYWAKKEIEKSPSNGFVGIFVLGGPFFAIYKLLLYWGTLFLAHNIERNFHLLVEWFIGFRKFLS